MKLTYGSAMKELRLEKGLSLREVEKATEISNQNLSRWERNEVIPSVDACVKLAKFYGVSIEELIGIPPIR